jgi:ssDNA-binding replication factor A large subunit
LYVTPSSLSSIFLTKYNLRQLLDSLSKNKQESRGIGESSDTTDLAKQRKEYYRTTMDNIYTPIKALNTYSFDWKIKVRVIKKFDKREWKNARASGSILNVHLVDSEGTQISATFFNQAADIFDPEIHENRVYLMANGHVKQANKKYSLLNNDFSINFDRNAEIVEVEDDETIKDKAFDFRLIKDIQDFPENSIVDFIGIVHHVGPINDIYLKNGSTKQRRMLLVTDDSKYMITL